MVCRIILQIVNLLKQEVKTSGKMYFLCLYFHKYVSNNSLTFISILIGNLDFFLESVFCLWFSIRTFSGLDDLRLIGAAAALDEKIRDELGHHVRGWDHHFRQVCSPYQYHTFSKLELLTESLEPAACRRPKRDRSIKRQLQRWIGICWNLHWPNNFLRKYLACSQ